MRDFAFPPQHEPTPPRHGGIRSHRLPRRAWQAGVSTLACLLALTGCVSLAPHYTRPVLPVPDSYSSD
ncbi:MAG: hypothetical protein KGQ57_07560, partial [Burkholderiales bacterium]|nr:hypothetical protein [Burkholderiales bacterium]